MPQVVFEVDQLLPPEFGFRQTLNTFSRDIDDVGMKQTEVKYFFDGTSFGVVVAVDPDYFVQGFGDVCKTKHTKDLFG